MTKHKNIPLRERMANRLKNKLGYGTCYWCGGAWNWKEPHEVRVDAHGGFFICCEECWANMSVQSKIIALGDVYSKEWKKNIAMRWTLDDCIDAVKRENKREIDVEYPDCSICGGE